MSLHWTLHHAINKYDFIAKLFLNIYSKISRYYQHKEMKYNWPEVEPIKNLYELQERMMVARHYWTSDSPIDHISRPEKIQEVLDNGTHFKNNLDCDEYAIYCCKVLDMYRQEHPDEITIKPKMMAVLYEKSNKVEGHFVCVYQDYEGDFSHASNWGIYNTGIFDNMRSYKDVAHEVASQKGATLLTAWTVEYDTLTNWQRVI